MTKFADSLFARSAAAAALYPMPTIKEATQLARAMGVMIRRDYGADGSADGFQVYRVGYPETALYAECPAESLFLAECLAHDHDSARLSLSGRPTLRAVAAVLAYRAGMMAGVELAGEVATEEGQPVFYFRNAEHGVQSRAMPDVMEPLADIGACVACAAEAAAHDVAARIMVEPEEAPARTYSRQELANARAAARRLESAKFRLATDNRVESTREFHKATKEARYYGNFPGFKEAFEEARAKRHAPCPKSLSAAATPPGMAEGYTGEHGPDSAALAAMCARASTPALKAACAALVRRLTETGGGERASVTNRLRAVCAALAERQKIALCDAPANAPGFAEAAAARRAELDSLFALRPVRPASYDVRPAVMLESL